MKSSKRKRKEKTMQFAIDHDLHIHSKLSICSRDAGQTTDAILAYAQKNHLSTVCITDHFWDFSIPRNNMPFYDTQDVAHIKQSLPLPQAEGVRFLFGGETDMDIDMTIGVSKDVAEMLDFLIVPTTHLHMALPPAESYESRALHYIKRIHAFASSDLPFHKVGFAHATTNLIAPVGEDGKRNSARVLEKIPDSELYEAFRAIAQVGAGVEINFNPNLYDEKDLSIVLRTYFIAKECGCKFYLGSDAHHPADFEKVGTTLPKIIGLLSLQESDKFHI